MALTLQDQQEPRTIGDLSYNILQLWHATQPLEQRDCWILKTRNQQLCSALKKRVTRVTPPLLLQGAMWISKTMTHSDTLTEDQRDATHGPTSNPLRALTLLFGKMLILINIGLTLFSLEYPAEKYVNMIFILAWS